MQTVCDPIRTIPSGKMPVLGTGQGFGFMFLHNTRPDARGAFFTTRWLMIVLPIVPLGRYYVRQGPTTDSAGFSSVGTSTEYTILGRSRLRLVELLRTLALFWVVFPAAGVGPIILSIIWDNDESSEWPQAVGALVGIVLIVLVLVAHQVYRRKWRPLREACWPPVPLAERRENAG
ncbi:hypothetical protein GCM10023214_05610 [Amycolatopsis dongchuanensis]|uniref:RDD domain-containing protein n=1 Tax=Amycolatopsis dongchuanensis TaxID=1070866 RepID=A0ABP9PWF0_9PSEU